MKVSSRGVVSLTCRPNGIQVYREIIGWTIRHAKSVTIAKAFSLPGGGNIIAGYAVRLSC